MAGHYEIPDPSKSLSNTPLSASKQIGGGKGGRGEKEMRRRNETGLPYWSLVMGGLWSLGRFSGIQAIVAQHAQRETTAGGATLYLYIRI